MLAKKDINPKIIHHKRDTFFADEDESKCSKFLTVGVIRISGKAILLLPSDIS